MYHYCIIRVTKYFLKQFPKKFDYEIKIITVLHNKSCLLSFLLYGRIVPPLCSYSSNLHNRDLDLANHMVGLILCYALIRPIYRPGIQIQPIAWSDCSYAMILFILLYRLRVQIQAFTWWDCSYAMLLFVQFTDQEFRSSQSHSRIVPTLFSYSSFLQNRDLDLMYLLLQIYTYKLMDMYNYNCVSK